MSQSTTDELDLEESSEYGPYCNDIFNVADDQGNVLIST